MKEVKLTRNFFAYINDEDFDKINKYKWNAHFNGHNNYARARINNKMVYMHHFILGNPIDYIDHKDGNGLNNMKSNLRFCTNQMNQANRKINKNNKSGYKGVSWSKEKKKWVVNITFNRKTIFFGYYTDLISAAKKYDNEAKKLFGEFAKTNFDI